MPTRVNVNGQILKPEDARISIFDHGFLYGDSVYETLRTHRKRPFLFAEHFERLEDAAAALALEIPWSADRMQAEVGRTLQSAEPQSESLIRIIITRGVGELTPDPKDCRTPMALILAAPLEEPPAELYQRGVAIVLSTLRRDPAFASIKTGSLIHQVLGAREARLRGAAEAIFLTSDGLLSDGTRTNIFLVRDGSLMTPSVESGIVRGITRAIVIEAAGRCGVPLVEGKLHANLLLESEEAFITSTTRGVLPVAAVDGATIGNGEVGPITRRIIEAFRTEVERRVAKGGE